MELIRAENDSIEKLAQLASGIWHEYWPCLLSDEQIEYMVEKFQSARAIKEQIKNDNYTYYFIVSEGEIAGYAGISDKKDYLFLSKLYIKKDFRHKGLGKLVIEKLKQMNFPKIQLTVNKYNKNTIDAYLKYGFKIVDSVVSNIGCGFVMDDYIMELPLSGN